MSLLNSGPQRYFSSDASIREYAHAHLARPECTSRHDQLCSMGMATAMGNSGQHWSKPESGRGSGARLHWGAPASRVRLIDAGGDTPLGKQELQASNPGKEVNGPPAWLGCLACLKGPGALVGAESSAAHRVVHGPATGSDPTLITPRALGRGAQRLIPPGALHNAGAPGGKSAGCGSGVRPCPSGLLRSQTGFQQHA